MQWSDPYDSILAILQTGSGYTIAPGVYRADAIIAAENVSAVPDDNYGGRSYKGEGFATNGSGEYAMKQGYSAALRADGSIASWSHVSTDWFSRSGQVDVPTGSGFTQIYSNAGGAFAALKVDGSIENLG